MPPGGNAARISPYIARASGGAGVFLTFGKNFAAAADWYDQLLLQRGQIDAELLGLSWRIEANGKIWIETRPVRYKGLDTTGENERVIGYLAQNTNAMVNVFRHRLEALQRQ